MKFTINEDFDNKSRKSLIKALYIVAEKYFNDINSVATSCGICLALTNQDIGYGGYYSMQELMDELLEESAFGKYTDEQEWEQRAYMCLFLSEYLKDTV